MERKNEMVPDLQKDDIAIVIIDGVAKYVRVTGPQEWTMDHRLILHFSEMWDIVLRPMQTPRGMSMDRAIIPITQALDVDKNTSGIFSVPVDKKVVSIAKLDRNSSQYASLMADSTNIVLPTIGRA